MAITEQSRLHMLDALRASIGEDAAVTLAEHLPPVGWADVATKTDLTNLRDHMDLRFVSVDRRFEEVDRRFVTLRSEIAGDMASTVFKATGAIVGILGLLMTAISIVG